ncbi:MAG TPA: aminotransferase class V-fold PLP-dependent enzyme [Gemmatimonadaceae bacterium]|nr:aminotransferase class V-fold PLP-dependent enzyme [Gemmatimonadaceae bacterium]
MNPLLARWRADTPGCSFRNHLNNAGAALMPSPVLDAVISHLRLESDMGGYEAAGTRASEVERGYTDIATLINAAPRNVAVVANATTGFIQALSSFDFAAGDTIVTSRCDYISNQIHYLSLRDRLGVRLLHAPDLPEGGVDPQAVREILTRQRCRLVTVSWVPTNSGLVQDVESVGAVCEEAGVPYIVDACQAVGQIPIDVERLKCDYLSATARKFLRGPRGIGFLYASDRALARGDHPLFIDMRGARWVAADRYDVQPTARRYEDWEFPYALVLGQAEAVRYALAVGIDTAQRVSRELAGRLRARLAAMPAVRVLDRGREQCAIVTAAIEGVRGEAIVARLSSRSINTVATLREYAQLDFEEKGVSSAVRISPHYYNTIDEVDRAADVIAELAAERGATAARV